MYYGLDIGDAREVSPICDRIKPHVSSAMGNCAADPLVETVQASDLKTSHDIAGGAIIPARDCLGSGADLSKIINAHAGAISSGLLARSKLKRLLAMRA